MSELVITILTGRRPTLLAKTLSTIECECRELLAKNRVIAMVNGGDEASVKIIEDATWIDERLVTQEPLLAIGPAVSRLWEAAELAKHQYLMHLEDDWGCSRSWYEEARGILDADKEIGQVRLRRHVPQSAVGHAVMRYHMVTGRPLRWEKLRLGGVRYLRCRAHFTFNPALIRASLAATLVPCDSELDAAKKFDAHRLKVAQTLPGAFRHLGGDQSLREEIAGTKK
jgi:hypothetical protein